MLERVSQGRRVLTPLAWLWRAGTLIDQARKRAAQRSLSTPVVSIGALTIGGAGKTPMVLHLARRLREMGRNPAILTRGYKRASTEPIVIVPRGTRASIETTGDEAQLFVRAGDAHVGIGANRYETGRRMERELAPDIFLLDDGFQHVQLHRDHDVVLIDGRDPEAGGIFPVGRLREPLSALSRATEIVVTAGTFASASPVFASRVVPGEWVHREPGVEKVAAFCGLGNPASFWRTLEELGIDVVLRREFGDHHRYRAEELQRLAKDAAAAGATLLATTEKDAMNLDDDARTHVAPLRLCWLRIGIELEREDDFLNRISGTNA